MQITYYGHSCFSIKTDGKKILINAFITPKELAQHIALNKLKPDCILQSHDHQAPMADPEVIYKNTKDMPVFKSEAAGTGEESFYYTGEAAHSLDIRLIGQEFDDDFAFTPIGYNFTVDNWEAVKAADFVKIKTHNGYAL